MCAIALWLPVERGFNQSNETTHFSPQFEVQQPKLTHTHTDVDQCVTFTEEWNRKCRDVFKQKPLKIKKRCVFIHQ